MERSDGSAHTIYNSGTRILADKFGVQQHDPNIQTIPDDRVAKISSQASAYDISDENDHFNGKLQVPAEACYANPFHLVVSNP